MRVDKLLRTCQRGCACNSLTQFRRAATVRRHPGAHKKCEPCRDAKFMPCFRPALQTLCARNRAISCDGASMR